MVWGVGGGVGLGVGLLSGWWWLSPLKWLKRLKRAGAGTDTRTDTQTP